MNRIEEKSGAPPRGAERCRAEPERGRNGLAAPRAFAFAGTADRIAGRFTLACDVFLDFLVVAFAAWTAIYHVCLVTRVGTTWAAVAGSIALVAAAWFVLSTRAAARDELPPSDEQPPTTPLGRVALLANAAAALAAATLFAFATASWVLVWLLWIVAAGAAVVATTWRRARAADEQAERTTTMRRARAPAARWPAAATALGWAIALGTLALFLVRDDPDDAQYVRVSAWVAAYGEFPLRDILFSNQVLPAIIFPWLASWEPLLGTVARLTDVWVPDLVYLAVPPAATALSVLATWRLLRTWRVRMVGVALSVTMVFLLMSAHDHRTLGSFFVGRIWQGKVVFLTVLVPLLLALLVKYADRPTGRRLVLIAAAGAAGVGLTSTAVFVVPVIAAGFFAPMALRAAKDAAIGFAATAAYPLLTGITTLAVGGHNAHPYVDAAVDPARLAELQFGLGVVAAMAIVAMLVGPVLVRHQVAARATAFTTLVLACLFAPLVPLLVLHATGLGGVLWRWMWAVPVAPLVGVIATTLLAQARTPLVRLLPSIAVCAALVVLGNPLWSGRREHLVDTPSWKRPPRTIETARVIYPHLRPGDRVAAPGEVLRTLLVMSGTITSVTPRRFYTLALRGVPGGYVREQLLVRRLAQRGIRDAAKARASSPYARRMARALRVLGVDLVCVRTRRPHGERLLRNLRYEPVVRTRTLSCLRAPATPPRTKG